MEILHNLDISECRLMAGLTPVMFVQWNESEWKRRHLCEYTRAAATTLSLLS